MLFLSALLAFTGIATASWAGNINYRSPSHNHPGLGLSIHKIAKRNVDGRQFPADQLNFTHGVASGDPYSDSVILWTRVSPMLDNDASNVTVSGYVPLYNHDTARYVNVSKNPICVDWVISPNKDLHSPASQGKAYTSSDIDYTIKVEATKLKPFTWYYYQFTVCGSQKKSPVGRTKSAPAPDDKVSKIALAVYSCSNFPFGFFNAFGNPARKQSVDYVIHLGDYYYEYKNGDYGYGQTLGRVPQPDKEIYTLYDYRRRIANYREDLDLTTLHESFATIQVWDDHEVSDNTYRDGASELNNTEASFVKDGGVAVDQRKMNAVRAYFEWMPIRQAEMDDNLRIWRSFSLGTLVDLIMLDTRQYDRSITDLYWNTHYVHEISNDAGRSMMGSRQENWFYSTLSKSKKRLASWRIIGSQTVFSREDESFIYPKSDPLDYDAWDGYQANRNRTLNHLYENNITNNIVISGDSHLNWASDLVWLDNKPYEKDTGAGAIGVEFAGTAVSSPSPYGQNITLRAANNDSNWITQHNAETHWQESYYRGYYELNIYPDRVDAQFFGMPTILTRNPFEVSLANFTVRHDENHLQRPVAGGRVEAGALKTGSVSGTNITNDTSVAGGRYFIHQFPVEDL